jgi:hypothetical protein
VTQGRPPPTAWIQSTFPTPTYHPVNHGSLLSLPAIRGPFNRKGANLPSGSALSLHPSLRQTTDYPPTTIAIAVATQAMVRDLARQASTQWTRKTRILSCFSLAQMYLVSKFFRKPVGWDQNSLSDLRTSALFVQKDAYDRVID